MTDLAVERRSATRETASSHATPATVDYPRVVDLALLAALGTIQVAWLLSCALVIYRLA